MCICYSWEAWLINVFNLLQKSSGQSKSDGAAVDTKFFIQLLKLIKIIIPGAFTAEVTALWVLYCVAMGVG